MSRTSDVIDAADVLAWMREGVAALASARAALDRVNVFPVADSDTGTNMYLTLLEARRALPEDAVAAEGAGDLLVRVARGALVGARGNSGVILSEFLRGLALALAEHRAVTGPALADALAAAARTARGAVARPAPGTVLTAADEAAQAAARVVRPPGAPVPGDGSGNGVAPLATAVVSPVAVAAAAHDGARAAALRSVDELDVLARAHVLDAGALGLTLLLGALRVVLCGTDPRHGTVSEVLGMMAETAPVGPRVPAAAGAVPGGGEFEVMYVVDAPRPAGPTARRTRATTDLAADLRGALGRIGDSVVVVGGRAPGGAGDDAATPADGLWQAHVHTDEPVAAVAAGWSVLRAVAGETARLRQVRVRHLPGTGHGEVPEGAAHRHGEPDGPAPAADDPAVPAHARTGLVAVTTAPGLVADLARAGAVVLLREPGDPVDPGALLRVVVDTGASRVVVAPGTDVAPHVLAAVRDAARADGVERLDVLDATTDLHVVAALAAAQLAPPGPGRVEAARAAAAAVRVVPATAGTEAAVLAALADVLVDPVEVLTLLCADDVGPGVVDAVVSRASAHGAETVVLRTGRRDAAVALAAEPPGAVGHAPGGTHP